MGSSPCLVNSWRMSHFGIKPVSGGRPPRERRTRGVSAVRIGVFAQEMARELMLVALFVLKIKNVEKVITKYMIRVRKVSDGEYWSARVIHPRCAIDE